MKMSQMTITNFMLSSFTLETKPKEDIIFAMQGTCRKTRPFGTASMMGM